MQTKLGKQTKLVGKICQMIKEKNTDKAEEKKRETFQTFIQRVIKAAIERARNLIRK